MPGIKVDYAVRETVTNMRRNVLMAVAAVLVVAVSLFLVGGVLLVTRALNRVVDVQTHKVEVGVFLIRDITPEDKESLQRDLLAMPEVDRVIYESKQEAYEHFKILFKDSPDIVANVTPDSLPESFHVKLKKPSEFSIVRDRLANRPGIDKIRDQREFLKRFFRVVQAVRAFGIALMVVFAFAAAILIATTIRMAIYARRKEIAIMKLVGATNWFIRIPFMMEGILQGVVGAIVAVGLLLAVRPFVSGIFHVFQFLGVTVSIKEILLQTFLLMAIGIGIGGLGSLLGLRRYLEV
ncbi:MAG: permease-like cell division protein FtsX [Actinomycetota bacterium]|nr:permease-like cell division protein FtsX [Actinomycetota bacterium]